MPATSEAESTIDVKSRPRTRGVAQKIIRKKTMARSAAVPGEKKSTAKKAAAEESVALLTLHSGAATLDSEPVGFGAEIGAAVRRSTRQAAKARRR